MSRQSINFNFIKMVPEKQGLCENPNESKRLTGIVEGLTNAFLKHKSDTFGVEEALKVIDDYFTSSEELAMFYLNDRNEPTASDIAIKAAKAAQKHECIKRAATFYLTFGFDHTAIQNAKQRDSYKYHNGYVIIKAFNYEQARSHAFKIFGNEWAFCYDSADFNNKHLYTAGELYTLIAE